MSILSTAALPVNPTFSDAEFSAWCARQSAIPFGWDVIEPETETADKLAWHNDGGEFEDYPGPGWQDDQQDFEPSVEDEMNALGHSIGRAGGDASYLLIVRDRFPELLTGDVLKPATYYHGERSFYQGLFRGQDEHCYQLGYDRGVAGDDDVVSAGSILMPAAFARGWRAGADDWADRQAIMAGWDAEADSDARWHEAEVAEAGGWYRAALLKGGAR